MALNKDITPAPTGRYMTEYEEKEAIGRGNFGAAYVVINKAD